MRPELPTLSFLCLILLTALMLLHVNSRNVAILALIGWLLMCSFIQGVDSIVWSGNAIVHSPAWCDIGKPCTPYNALFILTS
jgi:pheromone a factor receptor